MCVCACVYVCACVVGADSGNGNSLRIPDCKLRERGRARACFLGGRLRVSVSERVCIRMYSLFVYIYDRWVHQCVRFIYAQPCTTPCNDM